MNSILDFPNGAEWRYPTNKEKDEIDKNYPNLFALSYVMNHDIVYDRMGVVRWKANRLSLWIWDIFKLHKIPDIGFFNYMAITSQLEDAFSLEEYVKFHMEVGYSLSGFMELFGKPAEEFNLESPKEGESVIDWIIRKTDRNKISI